MEPPAGVALQLEDEKVFGRVFKKPQSQSSTFTLMSASTLLAVTQLLSTEYSQSVLL